MKWSITVQAPINIALIKYWGKSDEALMLPCNDSISITIDSPELLSVTTVEIDENQSEDEFALNGMKSEQISKRICATIAKAREFARTVKDSPINPDFKMRIISFNTVPTASGLASSASGLAALAFALIKLYELESRYDMSTLSEIARLGSGSAGRSLFGGFVHWSGSNIRQICRKEEWAGLNGFVIVLSDQKKEVASTAGMQQTVATSDLFDFRVKHIVPERVKIILEAIEKTKNFSKIAEIAMKDSNSFHACCLDTFPPIPYLTYESFRIINFVHQFNSDLLKRIAVGYTFDAGPNAVIFGMNNDPSEFIQFLRKHSQQEYKIIPWNLGDGPCIRKN